MSTKFAIVFLAFVAYQGIFASAQQAPIDKAVEALNDLLGKIVGTANKLIDDINNQIYGILDGAKEDINNLVEKSQDLGVDMGNCVEESNDRIEALAKDLVESTFKCVTDKVDEATCTINEAIDEIKDYINVFMDLEEKVKGCGSGWRAFRCLVSASSEVIQHTANLSIKISQKVSQIVALVSGLEAAMAQCATDISVDAAVQVGVIVIDAGLCVADTINE